MQLTRIIVLLFLFPLLISLSACGKSPEKARKELAQMNIEYTKENFLKHTQQGDSTVVDLFLTAGMDPNTKDENFTALHIAAGNGHVATVQALLSAGADIDAGSERDMTPLMTAAMQGHVEVVKVLIAKGAIVNEMMVMTYDSMTEKNTEIVKLLKDAGAKE